MSKDRVDYRNVKIRTVDLTYACLALGDVHVRATDSIYVILACNERMRAELDRANIRWSFS
jgi:hypothetical protein